MPIEAVLGDPLTMAADVLVLPVGPYLLLEHPWDARLDALGAAADLEHALQQFLDAHQFALLRPGTIIETPAAGLLAGRLLNLVTHDVFGDASEESLWAGCQSVFRRAAELDCRRLVMGDLSLSIESISRADFAWVLRKFREPGSMHPALRATVCFEAADSLEEVLCVLDRG